MSLKRKFKSQVKGALRQALEACKIDWYSRPALDGLDTKLERYLDFDGGFFCGGRRLMTVTTSVILTTLRKSVAGAACWSRQCPPFTKIAAGCAVGPTYLTRPLWRTIIPVRRWNLNSAT